MKIISKRKDYYDHLSQIYGVDGAVVYKRQQEEYEEKEKHFGFEDGYYVKFKDKCNNDLVYSASLSALNIWFCDKLYPVVRVSLVKDYQDKGAFYYYSYMEYLQRWGGLIEMKGYNSKRMEDFFKAYERKRVNTEFSSPQLVHIGNKVVTDIILKDYGFQKVITPEQAFQRVSMFVASKPDAPQTIPTDMHRFEAKGFSKKTSFRNM